MADISPIIEKPGSSRKQKWCDMADLRLWKPHLTAGKPGNQVGMLWFHVDMLRISGQATA